MRQFPARLLLAAIVLAPSVAIAQQTFSSIPEAKRLEPAPPVFENTQLLTRMGDLYRDQAAILDAAAKNDVESTERLLNVAMGKLAALVSVPGATEDQRFRELYRTIITEYEAYYGVSDTLELPNGSIVGVHDDMFAMIDNDELLETIKLPDLEPMVSEIPMDVNRLVEQSITYLLKNPTKTLDLWRPRSDTYFPMIEQILREEGVPDEMKYLAMIESGLNPKARSWARANGMWQFIAGTGKMYDLRINRWVDERLDPEKATRAAARHLRDLYQMFGQDWHLAMAGYNCSPARVRRAIRRAEASLGRKATFWDIYQDLPRETRNYVPMFIATALVISNPDDFKLRQVDRGQPYEYEYVGIKHTVSLAEAARWAGTSVATIKALNPEITTATSPPMDGTYPLRVPAGSGDAFVAQYVDWAKDHPATRLTHTVRSGESLGKIANRYGVTISELRQANGISGTVIHPGQVFLIPYSSYTSETAPEVTDAQPIRVSYGASRVMPVAITGLKGPQATSDGTIETLVANTHGEATVAAQPVTRTATTNASTSSSTAETGERISYRVRRGDSLGKIASRHGVTIAALRRWNNIRGSRIYAGQSLVIYQNGSGPAATADTTYRVRSGDSLYVIARKYGVTINQLKSWNSLRSNVIRPGQVLKVKA